MKFLEISVSVEFLPQLKARLFLTERIDHPVVERSSVLGIMENLLILAIVIKMIPIKKMKVKINL